MDILSTAMTPKWFLTTYVIAQIVLMTAQVMIGLFFVTRGQAITLRFIVGNPDKRYFIIPAWVTRFGISAAYEVTRYPKILTVKPIRFTVETVEQMPPEVHEWCNNTIRLPIKKKGDIK